MQTNEAKFYEVLENLFLGVKIEKQEESILEPNAKAQKNGIVNLMQAKSEYYRSKKKALQQLIHEKCQDNNDFKEELFDKLYSFFRRYFSANGGIYFNYTPLFDSIYTKSDYEKCSLKKDTALFYKTKDLYYVKSEIIYRDLSVELDNLTFNFNTSNLESKKSNEKINLVFNLESVENNTLNFSVTLSSKGSVTKISDILKECKKEGVKLNEETLKKALASFSKQSSMDFFIHKNAYNFLKEQLDLYLFTYLFKEISDFKEERLQEINIIKDIALNIIELVSSFENELSKIWNKPRFVLNSHFIVSLDRLKAKNYDLNKIKNHKNYNLQLKEWEDLGLQTRDNLIENEFLPLDTNYFKDLEQEIKNLFNEDEINGTLIKSENYQALNSLKNRYQNKIDCIYIDPPYNTQNNEFIYIDRFKHSTWLSMMANRLELAHSMLNDKGVMFVSIDDNEQAYCKVLMDEIFNGGGGDNFVANLIWRKKYGGGKGSRFFVDLHEYILVYAKNINNLQEFYIERNDKQKEIFTETDKYEAERGKFYIRPLKSGLAERKTLIYPIECPDGSVITTQWICAKETFEKMKIEERIVFKKLKNGSYNVYKKFYEKDNNSQVLTESIIYDLAYNQQGKEELKRLFNISEGRETIFENPKPEALIKRILEISTQENDLVCDFFAGSGTTCAVAHKLNRKYIGIEMGEHFDNVVLPRIKKVIGGFKSGISKDCDFLGGGVVKVYELESYEEILRHLEFKNTPPSFLNNPILKDKKVSSFLDSPFLGDMQLSECVQIIEDNFILDLSVLEKRLHKKIDLKESLENHYAKEIEKIENNQVVFKDKKVKNLLECVKDFLVW
ncbi:site-specific DNA-methyltransferase [Helicobacter cetorum]|uniref:site-specific DNA-methyltransferase n=1 Tax=Helicobacter cetorum TaxID=138563 RepID=UPI000CF0EAC7|nr:site-specific DNA-methyltransferase [Helicobacter cetorum]